MSVEIALERIKRAQDNKFSTLDLSGLGLTELPEDVSKLTHLTSLFLGYNRLTEIQGLEPLTKLEILTLYNNQLTEIPKFLTRLNISLHAGFFTRNISEASQFQAQSRAISRVLSRALSQDLSQDLVQVRVFYEALVRARCEAGVRFHRAQDEALDLDGSVSNKLPDYASDEAPDEVLVLALQLALALDLALDLPRTLDQAIGLDLALTLDLARDIAVDLSLGIARDIAVDLSLGIARNITLARDLARDLACDLVLDRGITRNILQKINQTLGRILSLAAPLDPDISLTGIYASNNPFTIPPLEVIKQGNQAIKTFLEDFVEKESLNEVKVILVGEGACGKTSLVKRLLEDKFDKKEGQTHGIKISKHQFVYQEEEFLVNFWDFGGQEIMHATHQFFLTKRCLYILVLDSRKDEKAEYWLNYIQSFGGDAPVIVILNKIDENPSFDVNRKFLSKKYPNIIAYYKVSCLSEEGFSSLKKDLMDHLWNLELRHTGFPKGWLRVKEQMEAMSEDYISYSKYQSICEAKHVSKVRSQKVLLELLNDLGVVLNYEKLRWHDTQVLNPLWLTNAVYRIINSPILAKSNGRFNINDLDAIINDLRYQKENPEHWTNVFKFWKPEQKLLQFPEKKFLFIVAMMKEFELLFQIDEYHYLIPGLLSDDENSYSFDDADPTLSFVIEYVDFLPTSIIPRLMVKLNKYIYNEKVWKTGMVLEEKLLFHSIANIVLDKESKKINIEIQGKRNRDFLTVIRETIKEINATYQDLDVTEWIPLPELYKEEQLLVSYMELLGYEVGNKEQYYSGMLRKDFPVADLLNGIEKPEVRKLSQGYRVFVSYAHEDHAHKERLLKHLMPLVRLNKATLWDDSCIDAGEEWEEKILENLAKADMVLCLISNKLFIKLYIEQ